MGPAPRPRRHRYDLHVSARLRGLVLRAGGARRAAALACVLGAALALAVPALLGAPGQQEGAQARAGCSTADVRQWAKENLQPTVQQQRCWLRSLLPRRKRKKNRTKKAPAPA